MHTHTNTHVTHTYICFQFIFQCFLHQERITGTPRTHELDPQTHELEACKRPPKLIPNESSPHTQASSRDTSLPAVTSRDMSLHTAEASSSPLAWIDGAGLILRVEDFGGQGRAGDDRREAAAGVCTMTGVSACALCHS